MSAPCVSCASVASPEDARFCVACGYARRQKCPNESCSAWLEVRVERPPSICGVCKRFLRVCPSCHRFHSLGSGECPTPRCARAHISPVEPNPIFPDGRGPLGSEARLPVEGGAARASDTWEWSADRGALWGAAARYGRLVGAGCERFAGAICTRHILKTTRELKWTPFAAPLEELGAPLENSFPWVPSPSALVVEGGYVFLAGQGGALRHDLGRTDTSPQLLRLKREVAAARDDLDWSGWGDESEASSLTNGTPTVPAPRGDMNASIHWRLACATSREFVLLGERGGLPVCLTHAHRDAIFQGGATAPDSPDFPAPALWRDLMAWDERAFLVSQNEVWMSDDDNPWRRVWVAGDPRARLRGALRSGDELWVWGEDGSGVSVWRLSALGAVLGAPAHFPVREVMCAPAVLGDEIVLAGTDAGGSSAIVCGRVALGQLARPPIGFPSGARAAAVLGIARGEQRAILLALESSAKLSIQVTTLGATTRNSVLGGSLSLCDDGAAAFAWCVADDRLIALYRTPGSSNSPIITLQETDLARAPFWNSF